MTFITGGLPFIPTDQGKQVPLGSPTPSERSLASDEPTPPAYPRPPSSDNDSSVTYSDAPSESKSVGDDDEAKDGEDDSGNHEEKDEGGDQTNGDEEEVDEMQDAGGESGNHDEVDEGGDALQGDGEKEDDDDDDVDDVGAKSSAIVVTMHIQMIRIVKRRMLKNANFIRKWITFKKGEF